jgi:hypothetical protein
MDAVGICNLALSHLGDEAGINSIEPADGTPQAAHCARYYALERDALLEQHSWGFAVATEPMALLTTQTEGWSYLYARPADCLVPLAVLPAGTGQAPEDGSAYSVHRDGIATNEPEALLRYRARIEDTSKFSPLFVKALSWKLAAALAGPILKGDAGRAMSLRCEQAAASYLADARAADSNARRLTFGDVKPSFITARG